MSSTLRLSIIMVLLLATAALGLVVKKYSVKQHDTGNTGSMLSADVSPKFAR
jgi:hypothetical protein